MKILLIILFLLNVQAKTVIDVMEYYHSHDYQEFKLNPIKDKKFDSLRQKLLLDLQKKFSTNQQKNQLLNFDKKAYELVNAINRGIYSLGATGDWGGSGNFTSFTNNVIDLRAKYLADLQFLRDETIDEALLKSWLGDAKQIFILNNKGDLKKNNFKQIINLLKNKITKIFEIDLNYKSFSKESLARQNLRLEERFFSSLNFLTGAIGSDKDVNVDMEKLMLLSNLEVILKEEFAKACKTIKKIPIALSLLIQSNDKWIDYRNGILSLYKNFKKNNDIIFCRLICFELSRIYFYKRFAEFYQKENKDKCDVLDKFAPEGYRAICAG